MPKKKVVKQKVALITGVSRPEGLGFAVARRLAEDGFLVVVSARDGAKARALADQLTKEGLAVHAMMLDVSIDVHVVASAIDLKGRFGRLDVLVNNAVGGFDLDKTVLTPDFDAARLALEVNFLGPWRLCLSLLPLLKASPAGRIVNVSSEAGTMAGLADPVIEGLIPGYSLSKTALNGLTVKLAHALRGTGVLVNAVCPGHTASHPEIGDQPGARSPAESAVGVAWAATLPPNGPTGGFFRDGEPLPW